MGESSLYFGVDGILYAKKADGSVRAIEQAKQSLISNPDFETWIDGTPDGWSRFWTATPSLLEQDDTERRSGLYSVRLTRGSDTTNARIVTNNNNVSDVNPGDLVTLSVWAKRSATPTTSRLEIQALTRESGNPEYFDGVSQAHSSSYTLKTAWTNPKFTFVVPTNHRRVSFSLRAEGPEGATVWVDGTESYATSPASGDSVITGEIKAWVVDAIPDGYLKCDGTVYNVSDYPVLGALLGSTYGGNGTSTFAVPNAVDRSIVGVSGSKPLGWKGGSATHSIPAHSHNASGLATNTYNHNQVSTTTAGGGFSRLTGPEGHSHNVTGSTGNAGAVTVDTLPPLLALNYIIKT